MLEKIFFNMIAFTLFIIMFGKLIRKNDTNYIYILIIQALGIAINFIELIFGIRISEGWKVLVYIFSVFIPIILFIMEYKWMSLSELIARTVINIYISAGDTEKAKKYCLDLIEKNPERFLAHKTLAEIYEKEGKNENALTEYLKAMDIENTIELNLKVARLYKAVGRRENAISTLEEILMKEPSYIDASLLLGEFLYEEERFKEAVNVYLNAMKHDRMNFDLYYCLGMTYVRLNDFQKAKEMYERAAAINAIGYKAKYNLGQIAMIYNDLDEAEKYFLDTINGEDVEAESYYYLAEISLIKGEEEKAIQYANVAVELDSRIMKKIEKNPLFLFCIAKIIQIDKTNIKENKLSIMEVLTQEHFDKTFEVVGKLNNNDIKMALNKRKIRGNRYNQEGSLDKIKE